MSLNGFFARAKMRIGKLVPSFGFGGGDTDISQFFGCTEAEVTRVFCVVIEATPTGDVILDTGHTANVALEVSRSFGIKLSVERVDAADAKGIDCR